MVLEVPFIFFPFVCRGVYGGGYKSKGLIMKKQGNLRGEGFPNINQVDNCFFIFQNVLSCFVGALMLHWFEEH